MSKNVLVLGAGLVAAPLIEYLRDQAGCRLVIGSTVFDPMVEALADGDSVRLATVDAASAAELEPLIQASDLVISLLPASMHVLVGKICVATRRPLVTASYVSDGMRALDGAARAGGVILLNECGLDPGIDHMAAMHTIDRVRSEGGRVVRFSSMTGGLPAPESDDNPWHYKFSWSPAGVLRAATRPSRYIMHGEIVEVPGDEIFDHVHTLEIEGIGPLEVYPNGDSVGYRDAYGLSVAEVVFRGTMRYPGHCETWKRLAQLGFFDEKRPIAATTYADLVRELSGHRDDDARRSAADFLGVDPTDTTIEKFAWLGLFEDRPIDADASTSAFQALLSRMLDRFQYAPGEKDMIAIHKRITIRSDEDHSLSRLSMTIIAKGTVDQQSAMSRTVGWPAAIAARLILEGRTEAIGVRIPNRPEIYDPVLSELRNLGLEIHESVEPVDD